MSEGMIGETKDTSKGSIKPLRIAKNTTFSRKEHKGTRKDSCCPRRRIQDKDVPVINKRTVRNTEMKSPWKIECFLED